MPGWPSVTRVVELSLGAGTRGLGAIHSVASMTQRQVPSEMVILGDEDRGSSSVQASGLDVRRGVTPNRRAEERILGDEDRGDEFMP